MQIIFIHHSCFVVEVDEKVLIFDYFNGDKLDNYSFHGQIPTYEKDTEIYVFASHKHSDHFDLDILKWAEHYTNIRYVLSKDIRLSDKYLERHNIPLKVKEQILFVTHTMEYELNGIKIETLASTDVGVAFYVTVNGISIYHAGDLNNWKYEGVGELINGYMERSYHRQIKKLSDKPIHIAFVPMDPRLGCYQHLGIDYFLKTTEAEYVFPMHMWQDYASIHTYKGKLSNQQMADRIIEINRENQTFMIQVES